MEPLLPSVELADPASADGRKPAREAVERYSVRCPGVDTEKRRGEGAAL